MSIATALRTRHRNPAWKKVVDAPRRKLRARSAGKAAAPAFDWRAGLRARAAAAGENWEAYICPDEDYNYTDWQATPLSDFCRAQAECYRTDARIECPELRAWLAAQLLRLAAHVEDGRSFTTAEFDAREQRIHG